MTVNNETEIELLKRCLDREKRMRRMAEEQLEVFSREVYKGKQLLTEQTLQVQRRQEDNTFLMGLMSETWHFDQVREIIENYLKRTDIYLKQAPTVYVELDKKSYKLLDKMVFAKTLLGIDLLTDNPEAYISKLVEQVDWTALRDHTELESCLILQNEDIFSPTELDTVFSSFILMPVYSQVSEPFKRFILCFFDERDAIDLMKIYTLESSRQLLDLALERSLAINSLKESNADLHLLNETLTATQNQLIESEKLASLGMLSAGVAHEINNPLAFINSNFESLQFYVTNLKNSILELRNFVLKDDDDMSQAFVDNLWRINKLSFIFEDSEELLDSSKDGVNRVKNIVADLKAFSRMDNQELEAVDLDKAITSSLNIVTNELKYEYEVKLDLNSTALIWGTVSQLQQVFVNLLVNAKDAMPGGGVIDIKTVRQGNRIYVHLKDYGVGMNKEQQQNMFTPFYTTKRVGEGTGLGLSISYSILQQHHAKVEVISELGQGTEFILGFLVCDG